MSLVGQRRGEVAGLVRSELNGDGWKLPSERSKNGQGHLVPISDLAKSILDDCQQHDDTEIVFASYRRVDHDGSERLEPCEIAGWSKLKRKLDKAILEIRREDLEAAGGDPSKSKPLVIELWGGAKTTSDPWPGEKWALHLIEAQQPKNTGYKKLARLLNDQENTSVDPTQIKRWRNDPEYQYLVARQREERDLEQGDTPSE
ncbi:MAG: hypothetical protein OEN23_19655 [Paracoccaceae bacterium]|nr:hypothetical protein [Paracoccaceae bacterium]